MAIETPKQKKLEEVKAKRRGRPAQGIVDKRNKAIIKDLIGGMSINAVAEKYDTSTDNIYYIRGKSVEYQATLEPPHMTFIEIGKKMGMSESYTRIIYSDAMKKLKVIILEFDIGLEDFIHKPELWRE